jgi:t-SNARE complex subunit (syntaxin)
MSNAPVRSRKSLATFRGRDASTQMPKTVLYIIAVFIIIAIVMVIFFAI